jgi:homoserine O-acetyltransferase
MTNEAFTSSDSARSSKPLRHAKHVRLDRPLELELGGRLEEVTVAYETYGRLNERGDNAVLVCHALSGDSHVAKHDDADDPGWWDVAVGPGKSIDTDRYFVICPNVLGGCRGTTGPNSTNPATGRPYGADFPTITTNDMVEVQRRLVEHLGIERLLAVVGGSMGGHQALSWATRHPEGVRGAIPIASSARLTAQALAFDVVARNAILRDPNFADGQYYGRGGPTVGLALARMLGHITYLSPEAMTEKFETDRLEPRDVPTTFEKKFSVGSYLAYQGDRFVERFDANSYVTISMAMDLFDLGTAPERLKENLERSRCRWLVVSFTSDWLFPPEQSQEIVRALVSLGRPVTYVNVPSRCGHDAFLLADDIGTYGELLRSFLANLDDAPPRETGEDDDVYACDATSIFHPHRMDYDRIVERIPEGASVLDLGCGRGGLLSRLRGKGAGTLVGVELNPLAILECSRRGLDVIHADINDGLAAFNDRHFDFVVLSQTLQAVRNVEGLLDDMLRVGRKCIVSFPNFGYHKLRHMLAEEGRAPEAPGLLRFRWHNSPNIRFFTILDFEEFCAARGIRVLQRIALDTEESREVTSDVNRLADTAVFVVSR